MQYFVIGGAVLIMAACVLAPTNLSLGLSMLVGGALMVAGFVIGAKHYRCPFCGKSLMANRGAIPDTCPKCNEKLK